jgi:hypothetical protein
MYLLDGLAGISRNVPAMQIYGVRKFSSIAISLGPGGSVSKDTMTIAKKAAGTPKIPAETGAI